MRNLKLTLWICAVMCLLGYGLLSLACGMRYGIPVWGFAGDVVFGIALGGLILVFRRQALETTNA